MTAPTPSPDRRISVVVEMADLDAPAGRVVVSAALQLFGPKDPVDVVLCLSGVDEPGKAEALAIQDLCLSATPDPAQLPETLLLGAAEAAALPSVARVRAGTDDAESARAIALLTGVAMSLQDEPAAPAPGPDPETERLVTGLAVQRDRAQAMLLVARRDIAAALACHTGARRPHVAVLFQHCSYWGAVATLCEALAARSDVDVTLVAVDSPAARDEAQTTADFLRERGYEPRDGQWLQDNLSAVDVVVLDNPYDEFRPPALTVPALARAGVRLVAVPYGTNVIDGDFMRRLTYDMPLHRLAWRSYVSSPIQRDLYVEWCRAGADHVRALGTPKLDRILQSTPSPRARQLRAAAGRRSVVVWNPHFRLGAGGWSTFDRYVGPLLDHFARHDDQVLLIRPHFRLFGELAAAGQPGVERTIRELAARHSNIVLDEHVDYLDALTVADAMISDLSSLATEFMLSGKPIALLRRTDAPPLNADGGYFDAMYQADSWADVESFLTMVRRGRDPRAEERAAAVVHHFGIADGHAGGRVADDLVGALRAELRLDVPGTSVSTTAA